jgi:putative flippase GtrA
MDKNPSSVNAGAAGTDRIAAGPNVGLPRVDIASIQQLIRQFFRNPSTLWSNSFFRYLVAGGVNTLFGYGLFVFFITIKMHYALAVLLSTFFGVIFNFFSYGHMVFDNRDFRRVVFFFAGYGVGCIINVILLKVMTMMHINLVIAQAICIPIGIMLSYIINRNFVYRKTAPVG